MGPDEAFRFSPLVAITASFVTLGPLLAGIAMALRAIRHRGLVRLVAFAGIVLVEIYAYVLVFFLSADLWPWLLHALLAGIAAAWLWTAWRTGERHWLDASVVLLPALAGLGLVWAEHG